MSSRAARVGAGLLVLLLAAAALALVAGHRGPRDLAPRAASDRPTLLLLTSLPLVFGEQFGLNGGGSPTLDALRTRYRVVPIDVADARSLSVGRLLLMAHPLAQPAEDLVALDQWVQRGGHVLLLADPALDWPSKRALGDPLRVPPAFYDTGLLAHWGLQLAAPDRRGPVEQTIGGIAMLFGSPGTLSGRCPGPVDGIVADCRIGRGRAAIIADADFLQPDPADPAQAHANLQFLLVQLSRLEQPRFDSVPRRKQTYPQHSRQEQVRNKSIPAP